MSTDNDKPEAMPEPKRSVGYGSPPEATRFQKGRSGNPKGRPKGGMNVATVFTKTLREKVIVNEHGQRKTVTKLEAAIKQLVNKAASGELRALRQLVELARDAEAKQSLPEAQSPILNEIDQEVVDGILKRFQQENEHEQELPEGDKHDDKRS